MNAGQIYHIGMIVCYVLSGLAFALTVYLFFKYKMLNVFNVLSGRKLKKDMSRLSHLSGAASETGEDDPSVIHVGKKKKSTDSGTELLYGMGTTDMGSKKTSYDTGGTEQLFGSGTDTEELGGSGSDTEELGGTEELFDYDSGTEELDVFMTDASDTELL